MGVFSSAGNVSSATNANGFAGFGSFSGQADLSSSQGLYDLAQSQGGSVAQAANEIYHPTTGILSSIGNTLKSAFKDFTDIISVPSEAIAGIISPNLSVSDAISQHVTPSDVIFGDKDPNASVYQKVGSFLVRTATDILLDPLTYVTFGAGEGLLGLRAGTEISLGEKAAASVGKEALDTGNLNKAGQGVYSYLKGVESQAAGTAATNFIKTGDSTYDLAGEELQKLLANTIDSPIKPDFAKKALSNLLEKQPALTAELLDKGGIKVFGQSILSGQRIRDSLSLVPGMTMLDNITKPTRMAISSLFNPNVVKAGGQYVRLPQEYVDMAQKWTDFAKASSSAKIQSLDGIVKNFNLNETEARYLTAALEYKRIPADARLASAYKGALGFNDEEYNDLVKSGLLSKVSRIEAHVPHILVKNSVGSIPFRMPPSVATGATELRQMAKFTDVASGVSITGHAGSMGLKPIAEGENAGKFINKAGDIFDRAVEPIHNAGDNVDKTLSELEGTLLSNPKAASKMLDDMHTSGFSGFDDNAITALAARSLKNAKANATQYFLKDLAANFGHAADGVDNRFVRISSAALDKVAGNQGIIPTLTKDGGELLYHPAIASHVEKFMGSLINDDATMDFLKAYDSLQNAWKATVTSLFPAFHGRNAISNVLNNYLDMGVQALNPRINAMSLNMLNLDRQATKLSRDLSDAGKTALNDMLSRTMFTDATGHEWTFGELRQVIKNNNIALTPHAGITSADLREGQDAVKSRFFKPASLFSVDAAKRGIAKPFQIGQDVGSAIEEHAKMTNFIGNLQNTGDVTLAARRTKQFLFDYGNLTNFEKTFMKRLIPFYTFTRKNIELQVRSLINTPGRIAGEVHAINTLGEVISGGQQLSNDEYNSLPDWVKSGIGILMKKNGDQVTLISNLGTPLEQPFQALQANQLLGSVSPLLRLPLEEASGYSFFQGKPLSEVTNASAFVHAPKVIQDLIGFTTLHGTKSDGTPYTWYVSLNPEMMNIVLNMPPTTRVLTSLKQMDATDVSGQAKILQQLTGLKPYSFDLARERDKREKEMMGQLETILTDAGVTAQFKRTFIPKSQTSSFSKLGQ